MRTMPAGCGSNVIPSTRARWMSSRLTWATSKPTQEPSCGVGLWIGTYLYGVHRSVELPLTLGYGVFTLTADGPYAASAFLGRWSDAWRRDAYACLPMCKEHALTRA